jgi:4-amino-4-deoxy-L-arabinose transferase-like glycosyltransferase
MSLVQLGRHPTAAWLVCLGALLALTLWDFGSHPLLSSDSGRYPELAQVLREGDGTLGRITWNFPWGYPLVLASWLSLSSLTPDSLRIPSLLATCIAATVLFWGWSRLGGDSYRRAVTALFCVSPIVVLQARLVLSEAVFLVWFLLVALLAVWGVERKSLPWWWWPATAAASTFMVFTRTVGWVMLAGIGLYWLRHRGRQGWLAIGVLAGLMAGMTALVIVLTPVPLDALFPRFYFRQYQTLLEGQQLALGARPEPYLVFLARTFPHRLTHDFPAAVVPALSSLYLDRLAQAYGLELLRWAVGLGITLTMGLGVVRWFRRGRLSVLVPSTLVYVVVLLVWDWNNRRFLHPVLAPLLYAFLLGAEGLALGLSRVLAKDRAMQLARGMMTVVMVALLGLNGLTVIAYPDNREADRMLRARGEWLARHTDPDAGIMSAWWSVDRLTSGRRVMALPTIGPTTTPTELSEFLAQRGVCFVVLGPDYGLWAADEEGGRPERAWVYRQETELVRARMEALAAAGVWRLMYTAPDAAFHVYTCR